MPPHILDPIDDPLDTNFDAPPELAGIDSDFDSDSEVEIPKHRCSPSWLCPLPNRQCRGRTLLRLLKKFTLTFCTRHSQKTKDNSTQSVAPKPQNPRKPLSPLPPPLPILCPSNAFGDHLAKEYGEEEAIESSDPKNQPIHDYSHGPKHQGWTQLQYQPGR